MNALEPGYLWVMRAHAALGTLIALFPAAIGGIIAHDEAGLPYLTFVVPVLLVSVFTILLRPARLHRAWGYRMDPRDLHIARGVWTRVQTVVPLRRVQHIDIAQGPIERAFGVCRLVLHTAGTMHSRVVLPGLGRATAEDMRDEIRSHIREGAD